MPPNWATGSFSRPRSTGSPGSNPAHQNGRLPKELIRLRRYGLIIVDEVGYIPFEQDAANLFFQLVSSRYEHASLVLTSNLPFARWGDVFGDQVVASP
ncbi:DNA replication protein DnaC [Arthrobacter globiformis]|nr:DNA replication protein DnaC [Arthrobacter globiformis]